MVIYEGSGGFAAGTSICYQFKLLMDQSTLIAVD